MIVSDFKRHHRDDEGEQGFEGVSAARGLTGPLARLPGEICPPLRAMPPGGIDDYAQ